ncbi:MAG: nucleotidyltransferase domain-containing protein [Candidatus Obscuribacterales bacterium]|nr:nucleotidyltransferase domain-containing protein [Candidatus Obscuribacterales bacterium]
MSDPVLAEIVVLLQETYNASTVILYGSRARGDQTASSDYDIACFGVGRKPVRHAQIHNGAYIDAWIYPQEKLENPDKSLLHIRSGIVIAQESTLGDKCLEKIDTLFRQGPEPLHQWEIEVKCVWIDKMLERITVSDTEGQYRRVWLLFELLENYFALRNLWYLGPKESFAWLKDNDRNVHQAFDDTLTSDYDIERIKRLAFLVKDNN